MFNYCYGSPYCRMLCVLKPQPRICPIDLLTPPSVLMLTLIWDVITGFLALVAGLIFLILSLTCKLIVLVLELCFMIISFPFLCIAEGFLCLMSDRDVADGLLETLVGIVPMGSDDDSVISLV
ncbi:unnamed protein product [Somion occarium]|uniref:Uncharacterized protein n=1 Tax=Somion occarium TaxID=3059160 RepID=A0ABP1D6Y0_9APHY